ncbi:MAG: inositol monophosphatase family protein [Acidimicrobiales bacterium]
MHDELLEVAIEAARRAGALLLDGRGQARSIATKSSATDMVSEMDRAAEAMVRAVIGSHRPHDAILGEEGGASAGATATRWIVDPLDGTTNFLYGFPAWAVSVAAEVAGVVVAGAVFDPSHDEMWTATLDGGAQRNGVALAPIVGAPTLATALVATGFSYLPDRRAAQGRVIAELLPQVRDIRRAGAAALDLCWLAAGRVDAYFEQGTQIWDWAAGALIAAEVGAWVGGFDGGQPSAEGLLAAPPALAVALRKALAAATLG